MANNIQYCEDCKHCGLHPDKEGLDRLKYARCMVDPQKTGLGLVSPKFFEEYHYCEITRNNPKSDTCPNYEAKK